jgi:hypothetical protein
MRIFSKELIAKLKSLPVNKREKIWMGWQGFMSGPTCHLRNLKRLALMHRIAAEVVPKAD